MITREQIEQEAKKLGIALTEDQINAYVTLQRMPEKSAAGSQPGDNDDDDDLDKDTLTEGMKRRLAKEKEKRSTLQKQVDDLNGKIQEFERLKSDKDRTEAEKKGEYEKLLGEIKAEREKIALQSKSMKERVKSNAIQSEIKTALLKAGVPSDRLPKAVKLFDLSKVEFDWTNEEALEYEIESVDSLVESFKQENEFLFDGEPESSNHNSFDYNSRRSDQRRKNNPDDNKKRLESNFPVLQGMAVK